MLCVNGSLVLLKTVNTIDFLAIVCYNGSIGCKPSAWRQAFGEPFYEIIVNLKFIAKACVLVGGLL